MTFSINGHSRTMCDLCLIEKNWLRQKITPYQTSLNCEIIYWHSWIERHSISQSISGKSLAWRILCDFCTEKRNKKSKHYDVVITRQETEKEGLCTSMGVAIFICTDCSIYNWNQWGPKPSAIDWYIYFFFTTNTWKILLTLHQLGYNVLWSNQEIFIIYF